MKSSPENFLFTNHFNRSLLKSRIEMMNRRRSSMKTLPKYLVYPLIMVLMMGFGNLNNKPGAPSNNIISQGDSIQWVITPKTSIQDLIKIQEVLEQRGIKMQLEEYKLDYLKRFLTKLSYEVSNERFIAKPSLNIANRPIRAYVSKIDLKTNRFYSSLYYLNHRYAPELVEIAQKSNIECNNLYLENPMLYQIESVKEQYGEASFDDKVQHLSVKNFSQNMKQYQTSHLSQSAICRDNVSSSIIFNTAQNLNQPNTVYKVDDELVSFKKLMTFNPQTMSELFSVNIYDVTNNFKKPPFVLVVILTKHHGK